MAHCDDTTVLFRGGQQALAEMKQYARRLVTQGGQCLTLIEQQLADFNSWCMDKWVSPRRFSRFISAVSGDVFSLPPAARRYDIRKNMNIYFYTLLTYGLTIVISFAVVGIIVGVNKMMVVKYHRRLICELYFCHQEYSYGSIFVKLFSGIGTFY